MLPSVAMSEEAALLVPLSTDDLACRQFVDALGRDHTVLAAKTHRVSLGAAPFAVIACLDHEAQLGGRTFPHVSCYVADAQGALHEVGFQPHGRRVTIDRASTWAETDEAAHEALLQRLRELFPRHRLRVKGPSYLRGDEHVAELVRAQVRLRDVLEAGDDERVRWQLEQLRAIADLMEKQSRVSSWAVRTLTSPLLAAAGVASYVVLGAAFRDRLSAAQIEALRYGVLALLGGAFLYVGLKAVHLTEMGTRVWKRATEYRLIVEARRRQAMSSDSPTRLQAG